MPLIGIHCPYKRKDILMDDCLACARTMENPCHYPAEVVDGIKFFHETEARKGLISATAILDCVRATYLERTNDYFDTLDHLYWAFRGQLGHMLCEKFQQEGAIVEKRFYRTEAGVKMSGKMDVIYPKQGIIRDFKTTKAVPKKDTPYSNHILQTNIYRWILKKPDADLPIEITKLLITYFDMKDTKTIEAPILDDSEIEKSMLSNGSLLSNAFNTGEIPDVHTDYPTHWKCSGYCAVAKECNSIWKMGQKK